MSRLPGKILSFFGVFLVTVAVPARATGERLRCSGVEDTTSADFTLAPGQPLLGSLDHHYYNAEVICKDFAGDLGDLSCVGQWERGKVAVFTSHVVNGKIKATVNVPRLGIPGEQTVHLDCEAL